MVRDDLEYRGSDEMSAGQPGSYMGSCTCAVRNMRMGFDSP